MDSTDMDALIRFLLGLADPPGSYVPGTNPLEVMTGE
jgi:hypothetical protein